MTNYKHPLGLKIIGLAWLLAAVSFDGSLWYMAVVNKVPDLFFATFAIVVLLALIGVVVLVWETWP
jgi:hypothetical protein